MEQLVLSKFNGDATTRDTVKEYLVAKFERLIVEKAYKGEDVKAAAEAIHLLEKAFNELSFEYGIKETIKPEEKSSW